MHRILIFSIYILICWSCSQKNNNSYWHSKFLVDSFSINVENRIKYLKPYSAISGYALILTNKSILEYSFSTKKILKIKLPRHQGEIIDFFPVNNDSIYYLTDNNIIILSDTVGNQKHIWSIKGLGQNYINIFSEFPFVVNKNKAYFYQYPDLIVNTPKNLAIYLETNRETIYDLEKDSIISNDYGTYPNDLKKNNKYIFNPIRTIAKNDNLVYSFPHSDSIYICDYLNKKNRSTAVHSSKFSENSLFDFSKINDLNYISKYLTENSRYGLMIYDKYRQKYYRVLNHYIEYYNGDNTINKWIDKPWTLIILNEKFEKIKEIEFPGKKFDFTTIIPTDMGVLIGDYKAFIIDNSKEKKYEIYSFQ